MAGPFAFRRISLVHNIGISWQYRLLKENQQEGNQRHCECVKLGQPRDNDSSEAVAACRTGGNGLISAADDQEARQAAERAGEDHGADDDLANVNAGVTRGIFAFADDRDFIALLGVTQIAIHRDRQHDNDNQIDGVALSHDLRKPSSLALHIQLAQTGSLAAPDVDATGDELNGDIIHHQGEQRFVGRKSGFKPCGDKSPDGSGKNAGDEHRGIQHPVWHFAAVVDHDCGGGQRAHQHLTFCARVPEAHFESWSERNADEQQRSEIAHRP